MALSIFDDLRALYTTEERIGADYPDMHREVFPNLIRQVPKEAGAEGFIAYTNLDATTAGAAIREQIAYFEQIGSDLEWKLFDYDTPPDLKERLAAHGFEIEEPEYLMILPLEACCLPRRSRMCSAWSIPWICCRFARSRTKCGRPTTRH